MARKSKEEIKKEKEVFWFVRKYLWKDQNIRDFVRQLSPHTIQTIMKEAFSMGIMFTWDDAGVEELDLSKRSIYDLVKLQEKTKC